MVELEKNKNKKKKNCKKKTKDKKGFTLIELLAVIIILGVLLLIAVPSISKYIDNSRKNTYINSVKSMVNAVSTSVNALELPFSIGKNEGAIVPFAEIELEKKGATTKSPYSKWQPDKSYILVMYDGENYKYYVSALDETGYGIPLVNDKNLSVDSITTDSSQISANCLSYEDLISEGVLDTDNLTMKYVEKDGNKNIIKVKVGHSAYDAGNVIQLKDGSKWYVTVASPLESDTVTLVSYYTMSIASNKYGQQDSTNPTIQFHASAQNQNPAIYDSNASIYNVAESIVSATEVLLVESGINMTGASVDMPILSDFGCSSTNYSSCRIANYFKESISFWTKETEGNWVFFIKNNLEIGQATTKTSSNGIRMVIRNLDKSNIDKKATRALN